MFIIMDMVFGICKCGKGTFTILSLRALNYKFKILKHHGADYMYMFAVMYII